jgi:hypothetical protein
MRRQAHDIVVAAGLITTVILIIGGSVGIAVMAWSTATSSMIGPELAAMSYRSGKNPWMDYARLRRGGNDALAQDCSTEAAAHTDRRGRSFEIVARIAVPESGADGIIATQGGRAGGWAFYLRESKPVFHYNFRGTEHYTVAAERALAPGLQTLVVSFAHDAGGAGNAGAVTLSANGERIAAGRIEKTLPVIASSCERLDIGEDTGTAVSRAYDPPFRFSGKITEISVTGE